MLTKKEMLGCMEDQIWGEGEDYFSDHSDEYDDIIDTLERRFHQGTINEDFFIDHGDEMTSLRGHDIPVNRLFSAMVTTAVDEAVYEDHPVQSVKDVFFTTLTLHGGWRLLDTLGFNDATK